MLKLKNDYEIFCMDEVALYLFMKWEKSERTWLDKWKGQSKTFTKKVDKAKTKKKTKFDKF